MSFDTQLNVWYKNYSPNQFRKFNKPNIVGYYSIDGVRNYNNTSDNLKYLKLPADLQRVNFDLNIGYENVIRKPPSAKEEGIQHLLEYIRDNKEKLMSKGDLEPRYLDADFICYRGLLRLIMCSPYESREDWCIWATKYKGNIYFRQQETEMKKQEERNRTEQTKRILSYGFKFEQYIFVDDPDQTPDVTSAVNESEEFSLVLKSKLEHHDILFGAEADGIASNETCDLTQIDINSLNFVEVKVRRKPSNHRQGENFLRFNLLKWWCQSFLVGIRKIYMGMRNDNGIVEEIKTLNMKDVPQMGRKYWSPAICFEFLNEFLNMVQRVTGETNCPYTVYEFYYNPSTSKTVTYKVHQNKDEYRVLPDWYIECISRSSNKNKVKYFFYLS